MTSEHEILYGNKSIVFVLIRKDVKNINITVKPIGNVVVSANNNISLNDVKKFVKRKSSWILKNKNYFKEARSEKTKELKYISGESVRYLGKQYRLKVIKSDAEYVKYLRGYIYVYVKNDKDIKSKKVLLDSWKRKRCDIVFNAVLDNIYYLVGKYGVLKPEIKIRTMRARWGSCHIKERVITLNKDLIKAPKHCIEYVILHELIHLMHKNHDDQFWSLLSTLMPDWESRKKFLDEEVIKNI